MSKAHLRLIYPKDDIQESTLETLSLKSRNLLGLHSIQHRHRFNVPDFFIMPTEFYRDFAERHSLEDRIDVSSVDDINRMLNEDGSMLYCLVPQEISTIFREFYDEYEDILAPAYGALSGDTECKRAFRVLEDRHHFFSDLPKWCLTTVDVAKHASGRAGSDPSFRADYEAYGNACKLRSSVILRSGSILEDNPFPFSGIFTSTDNGSSYRVDNFSLASVLESSYSPYAQFYMDHHNVTPVRDLEVIFQKTVNPSFAGEISFFNDGDIVESEQAIVVYWEKEHNTAFRVMIKDGDIVRYVGKGRKVKMDAHPFRVSDEKIDVPVPNIEEDELLSLTKIAQETGNELGYEEGTIEFVIDHDGALNFVQLKPYYRSGYQGAASESGIDSRASIYLNHRTRSWTEPEIPDEKRICTGSSATVGTCRGPIYNLVKHDMGIAEDMMGRAKDLAGISPERLKQIDEEHPGLIYIVNPSQFFSPPGTPNEDMQQRHEELFYMLTPRKKGLVIHNPYATWCHMDTIYRYDRVFLAEIEDHDHSSPILKVPDFSIVNIWSNGIDALFYSDL